MHEVKNVGVPVDGVQRLTLTVPGYDHRYGPDATPNGGIHGDDVIHGVRTELVDGRRVVLTMEVSTGRLPPTVPDFVNAAHRPGYYPRLTDLSLHLQTARASGADCIFILGSCDLIFTTSLAYFQFPACESDPQKFGWGSWPVSWGVIDHPHESFWEAMQSKLRALLRDPTLFTQPDEPPELRAAREGVELAERQRDGAQTLIDQWTAKRDAAIGAYLAKRGS